MIEWLSQRREKIFFLFIAEWIFYGACAEFYNIAWGTGTWLGEFSPKWALAFFLFVLFCLLILVLMGVTLEAPQKLKQIFEPIIVLRDRLGILRWVFAVLIALLPVYILQYTFWGIVLHGPYLRIIIIVLSTVFLGWLIDKNDEILISWRSFLTASLLVISTVVFFAPLAQVTSYPFSLSWSEGNRLWDYSIIFGRQLYAYPAEQAIPVYLDVGRQFVGGIPFLFSGTTIWQARLWLALIDIVPYLILGWLAFRLPGERNPLWVFLAGIWAFTFVAQGPIHPPLLLSAILVAMAWKRPLWFAIPVIIGASLFASVSRFTWLFAPGMWAGMLEFSGAVTTPDHKPDKNTWMRAISVGLAGIFGGYVLPPLFAWITSISGSNTGDNADGLTLASISASLSDQALLWYRLFPNETYRPGILLGLLMAIAPLILILLYMARTGHWKPTGLQKAAIILLLSAFLMVGLIVSTKIGGGGDLHNLDMFIIGLMFAGALAWRNGGYQWFNGESNWPVWVRILCVTMIMLPVYWPLLGLRPLSVTGDIRTIAVLADITPLDSLPNPLPGTLPSEEDTLEALNGIRAEVERTASLGEILFTDQRQLLTFGFVTSVPLVPEYDKKVMIDKALSGDAEYFAGFYHDLASRRFSLIISNPLNELVKTNPAEFGEENNNWVKWVSTPMLCYYEPLYTLKKVKVQILVPRQTDTSICAQFLP